LLVLLQNDSLWSDTASAGAIHAKRMYVRVQKIHMRMTYRDFREFQNGGFVKDVPCTDNSLSSYILHLENLMVALQCLNRMAV
jgi:hypothetical protein